ncbi:chloride channel protein [Aureimonas sp. AU20]|uniref:chloride channel protein n=1 Tax=Aureimonas sp. AU20 TaxID=1349819 RepID=UPI00071FF893|nr:chloride channel protein [Aureimonas sp. AU20]ALN74748.1 hypothetical protein M673_18670 [Aureimonas sp. AU20]
MKVPNATADVSASEATARAPGRFRSLVRREEIALVVLAAIVGACGGLLVMGISAAAQALHVAFFALAPGERLSGSQALASPLMALVPAMGGAILGLMLFWQARGKARALIDPIEANALHGGRMSFRDGIVVVAQNLVSNGFGASVGLEAAYTQISAGLASRCGVAFEMRRGDMRTLVGCGAAAAIAAAFDAPLTGAFYAFELIIGTYAVAALAPVVAAALSGMFVSRLLSDSPHLVEIVAPGALPASVWPAALVLAAFAAGLGILIMQGVTLVERGFRHTRLPQPLRPFAGGLLLGALALLTPQVLSSGHGALEIRIDAAMSLSSLAVILALKALASAISIGSGFRGGLFFASLFLGAMLGRLFADLAGPVLPGVEPVVFAVVGMSALATAIVGGPLTMTFLALEMTGDFPIAALVLAASVTTSLAVRRTFGYSFATWRFHLRGETIRSAHDVGWIRNLTVGRMMRRDLRTVPTDLSLKSFRRSFPLGSQQRVVAVDPASDAYAGLVLVPDAYADGLTDLDTEVSTLLRFTDATLRPSMNAREAMALFEATESEALAVVDGAEAGRVVGLLTESHVLRRYSEELDLRRREATGVA